MEAQVYVHSMPTALLRCDACTGTCRWNAVEHGSTAVHLELLPMLLGFFTYKAGVVGRGAFELLTNSAGSSSSSTPQEAATQAHGKGDDIQVQGLRRLPGASRSAGKGALEC